jgi:hypothetical protein
LPELHHCLQHIWCIWTHSSSCLVIISTFFGKLLKSYMSHVVTEVLNG